MEALNENSELESLMLASKALLGAKKTMERVTKVSKTAQANYASALLRFNQSLDRYKAVN